MEDDRHENPLKTRLRSARLLPVQIKGVTAPARVLQLGTDGASVWLGPVAFQTLSALVAAAQNVPLPIEQSSFARHIPVYRVNRPLPPLFLTFVGPDNDDLTMLIWQPGSFQTKLRCVFFPAGPASSGGLSWPTHEIVLHLPSAERAPEPRIEPDEFDLEEPLQVQLLNAAGRLNGDGQWVEFEETEFCDRAAGQGVPLPPRHIDLFLTALDNFFVSGGYLALTRLIEPAPAGSLASESAQTEGAKRGPISHEKIVGEHWVKGPRKSGGENCEGICVPEYTDPRHGACLDCGRKTWLRRGSVHRPSGAAGTRTHLERS